MYKIDRRGGGGGLGVSALDAQNNSTWQRHLAEKIVVLSSWYIKQIKNITKYQLNTNALKNY